MKKSLSKSIDLSRVSGGRDIAEVKAYLDSEGRRPLEHGDDFELCEGDFKEEIRTVLELYRDEPPTIEDVRELRWSMRWVGSMLKQHMVKKRIAYYG